MNFRRDEGKIVPEKEEDVPTDEKCLECSAAMVMKRGRFGRFLACTRYPGVQGHEAALHRRLLPEGLRRVHHREALAPWQELLRLLVLPGLRLCPGIGRATRLKPAVGAPTLDKYSKKTGPYVACPNKECGYRRDAEAEARRPGSRAAGRRQRAATRPAAGRLRAGSSLFTSLRRAYSVGGPG